MKARSLVLVSVASCSTWAFVTGCGSGGGYRGAFTESDQGGAQGALAGVGAGGAGGAGAGGANAGGAGAGGDGTSGQAGNAGDAAGMAGLSGGGNAGSASTAGAGAMSGAGVTAGNGGAGSGATAGAGTAGNGGTSGAAAGGMAGSGGPVGTCAERCNADGDCRIFGFDQGYRCNSGTHRCETFAEPCRTSVECIPEASFWIFDCNTDQDCFFFSDDLCVDVGGVGRCARLAPPATGCESPNADEIMLPRFGAAGSALVCANASLTCAEGACTPGCASNADCTPDRNGSVCDTDARLCRCVRDQDCGGPGVSVCNVTTGRCECSSARDCEELSNANACASGRCGCSAATACNDERTFSGTTYVCE